MLLRDTPVTQVGAAGQGAVEGTGLLLPTGSLCKGKGAFPLRGGQLSWLSSQPFVPSTGRTLKRPDSVPWALRWGSPAQPRTT